MTSRRQKLRDRLESNLWALPLLLTLVGVLLGVGLPLLDARLFGDNPVLPEPLDLSPAGARSLLSTAAGSLATILGVTFSITLVTLQLAATQYTSRILRHYLRDHFVQRTLGVFLGTVAYLLLVLRVVRSQDEGAGAFVPSLSLAVALGLTLVSLGLVAAFVDHLSVAVQVETILSRITRRTLAEWRRLRPFELPVVPPADEVETAHVVTAQRSGFAQFIDFDELLGVLPKGSRAQLVMASGDFVAPGLPLVSVWLGGEPTEDWERLVRDCFALGHERTEHDDLLFGVRQIVDVAMRALSPGIYDVSTAAVAVRELGVLLDEMLASGLPPPVHFRLYEHAGRQLYVPLFGLDSFLQRAFADVLRASKDQPRVLVDVLDVLRIGLHIARTSEQRRSIILAGQWATESARHGELLEPDREGVQRAWEALRGTYESPVAPPRTPTIAPH